MRGSLDLVQFLLWAEGFLCLLGVPALIRLAWVHGEAPWLNGELVYGISVAATAPVVAWGLQRKQRWAWPAGLVHGLLQLPVLPFLTAFGALEIVVFLLPATRRHLNETATAGPAVSWPRLTLYLATLTWAVVSLWGGARFLAHHGLPVWNWRELLPALPLIAFVDLVVHELGHVAAGWCAGFRFERLCLGPLLIRRLPAGWGISWHAAMAWGGGFVLAIPRDTRSVRPGLLMFFAGGPVASFTLAALAVMLFATAPGAAWAPWAHPLGVLAAWATFSFIANCSPVHFRATSTDGAWLAELAEGTNAGRRLCAHYAMAASENCEVRPADWNPRWIAHALALHDISADRLAGLLHAYRHHLDRGEIVLAGRFLDEAVNLQKRLPVNFATRRLWLERAYYLARHRGDALNAREAWERARHGLPVEPPLRLRAECALLMAEGDERAAHRLAQARGSLQPSGMGAFEERLIATLEA